MLNKRYDSLTLPFRILSASMKKIGVLTQPLGSNYGGLLQAFALQTTITQLGFQGEVVEHGRSYHSLENPILRNAKLALLFVLRYLTKKSTRFVCPPFVFRSIFYPFIQAHIPASGYLGAESIIANHDQYEKFIVGSDQTWRRAYNKSVSEGFMFLDFLPLEKRQKSFTYAASFGTDEWEGAEENIPACSQALSELRAISTREHSGVDICRDTFGVSAVQMPDPTLLLTAEDYNAVIPEKVKTPTAPYIGNYVLDSSPQIKALLSSLSSSLQLPLHGLMPDDLALNPLKRLHMGVPQWLASIRGAAYMLTDSFHGCVFCIIYNIPFVCLGNKGRGSARFDSLLRTFGLESRLVTDHDAESILTLLRTPIDWERVNAIRATERDRGRAFLLENLAD